MKLEIKEVDLEYCTLCSCDYVEVRDGASANGPLIGRYCDAKKTTVYSEGRQMWVKFKSDIAYEGRGFFASFTHIKLRKSKLHLLFDSQQVRIRVRSEREALGLSKVFYLRALTINIGVVKNRKLLHFCLTISHTIPRSIPPKMQVSDLSYLEERKFGMNSLRNSNV